MKIKKLNIKNFKGILSANISLGDLTVITGKNSSGKSSLIQSIKYITQWLNRVETTRGLNKFSAPGLNVYHPDFITENLRYDAIKNSKSSEGVSLGIEYENNSFSKLNPISGQDNEIQIDLEKASRKGEIARLKKIKINNEWLDKVEDDEQFSAIYSDETDAKLTELRRKYINSFTLSIFEPKHIRDFARDWFFLDSPSKYKDAALHNVWNDFSAFSDLIKPVKDLILIEVPDYKREEALIINNKGERLNFQKSPFEIVEQPGYKNFYINFFFDYVQKSFFENTDREDISSRNKGDSRGTISWSMSPEYYEELFKIISTIYKNGYDKQLSDYLQQDIPLSFSETDIEESFWGPSDKYPLEHLDIEYLESLKDQLPKNIFSQFEAITNLIHETKEYKDTPHKDSVKRIGVAQCVLMFIYFLNELLDSKNAIDLNKHIDELVSDNDMLTIEGSSRSILARPIDSIIELQNIIARSGKKLGNTAWENYYVKWMIELNQHQECVCPAEQYFNHQQQGPRNLEENEIVLECRYNPRCSHIYALTTEKELKDSSPNEYTQNPYVNFRGLSGRNSMDQGLQNFIEKKLDEQEVYDSKGTIDQRVLFFGSLLKEDKKFKPDYGKQAKSFMTSSKIVDSVRMRILDIEEREKKYQNIISDIEESLAENSHRFGILKRNLSIDSLSSEDRNLLNQELNEIDLVGRSQNDRMQATLKDLKIIQDEKKRLLLELQNVEEKLGLQSKKVDSKKLENLLSFIDTLFVPLVGYESKSISVSELSRDVKFLNNGRNPSLQEQAGVFNENLTVGKFGGLLPNLMFTRADESIDPYLFPSETSTPPFNRSFEELDWHILSLDNTFLTAFNEWVAYLEMEISQVESVMDGPNPMLKVLGKDDENRNIFEVGSGVAQVLPVIAICLLAKPGEVVCIEEPESNLHPSAQAYLADFLIAMAASGRQIIIETHSPNIIDRIRLRKAHKRSWRKLQNSDWVESSLSMDKYSNVRGEISNFSAPEISIIFAEQDQEGNSEYREAILDNNGDIIFDGSSEELWPKGFFDNTQEELSNILKARIFSEEE